jgi:hypothetical protein
MGPVLAGVCAVAWKHEGLSGALRQIESNGCCGWVRAKAIIQLASENLVSRPAH